MTERSHVNDQLIDRLLGDPTVSSIDEIDRHVSGCEECSSFKSRIDELRGLLRDAPIDVEVPGSLWDDARSAIRRDRAAELLRSVPFENPSQDLESRVFSDSRIVTGGELAAFSKYRRSRFATLVAAAALLAAIGIGIGIDRLVLDSGNGSGSSIAGGVPVGHDMQVVALEGGAGRARLTLTHFRHDNYRIKLETVDLPVQKPDHHYELWLSGSGGDVSAGSFRIVRSDVVAFVFNLGIDPAQHRTIEISEEPDDGGPSRQGSVVMHGELDPSHIEHK